jgi:predicted AAA+ superfamily ATPase
MFNRHITDQILAAIADTPVILINGARQTGKSTLMEWISKNKHPATYYTLDNATTLAAIKSDPGDFIANMNGPIILDEIQRAPEIFVAIKEAVDKNRKPGRFLLTGSANVLLLPKLSESLAGRMQIINLWPLSQGELIDHKEGFINILFDKQFAQFELKPLARKKLIQLILAGGYPEVLSRKDPGRRLDWFDSYITAILQRDIRDLANIDGLTTLPKLLSLLAARASSLLNLAELSRSSAISHTTLMRYMALLEATFLIHTVAPWSNNLSKRLVKTPKIFLNDTGLASYLSGINEERINTEPQLLGMLLENFVVVELKKQLTWTSKVRAKLFHYRTQSGQEIDIILEDASGRCVGIEVKSSRTVTEKDFKSLKIFAEENKDKFVRGIVLYTGDQVYSFGKNFYAVPVHALWSIRDL